LADNGIFTIVRFVFGYDTDDESVFERTARFCLDARIGLRSPVVTPEQSVRFSLCDQAKAASQKFYSI
jgi:hypothetical protein